MTNNRHLTLLKHDVKTWNSWRQENSDIELDFSGVNLSNLNLSGVNLSKVNLSRVDFSGANLKCAYLKRANLHQACLANADLNGSDLSEVELTNANLTNANISSANLQNANLANVNALLANFENSILTGACLENWQIDSSTNLEELVCNYFYGKKHKQQRYPQDEQQNFTPGEYQQFIRKDFNYIDAIVLANSSSQADSQYRIEQNNNIIDSIDDSWERDPENPQEKLIDPSIFPPKEIKQKKSIVQLSLAVLFGIIVTTIALGQIFKKSPNTADSFIDCDNRLLKQAEDAIFIRDEENLKQAIKQLEEFNSPLGRFADEQCRYTLYEVKYVYAIHIKATRENNLLEAVKLLCELPEQYYQKKKHKPWFLRWSNSFAHTNFPQQLAEHIEAKNCPAANYLYQNQQ